MSETTYRHDIDGIRAMAVLAVVGFHVGVGFLSGGFIGVDIFFVLSGFLIGSALLRDIEGGIFSVAEFYKRRVLRIAPALLGLLLVLTSTLPLLLLPPEVRDFSASLRSVITSTSNFYFAAHTNYFADSSATPLLHTWSLAVEEQFYFGLPLFLILLRKLSRRRPHIPLCTAFLISFVVSSLLIRHHPNSAFYNPFSRFWELLFGTLMSYVLPFSAKAPRWIRETMAVLGVVIILLCMHFYSSKTPFPGMFALLPCFGAALLILFAGNRRTVVSIILSSRPLVFIGLISYSLYLWHWPVTVITRMGVFPFLPYNHRYQTILIVIIAGALAIFSWKFIERPFRSQALRCLRPWKVHSTFGAVCLGLLVLNAATEHIPSRFSGEALAMSKYLNVVDGDGYRKGLCYVGDPYTVTSFNKQACLALDSTRPNVLILGDSHAAANYPGLAQVFPEIHFLQATAQGCQPFKDVATSADCDSLMKLIFYQFLPRQHVDRVVLISRWMDEGSIPQLDATILYLRSIGQTPVLIGPAPEYRASLPRLIAYAISRHDVTLVSRYQRNDLFTLDATLANHEKEMGVPYISQLSLLCKSNRCVQMASLPLSAPLLFDSNHFTLEGSVLVAAQLRRDKGISLFVNSSRATDEGK